MIKALETHYKGYRFRSRLEARWAIYFDTIGLKWEYEKEGYNLGSAGTYLPDFWLSQVNMWAEVKPQEFNQEENEKAKALANSTRFPVLRLIGMPDFRVYWAWLPQPPKFGDMDEMDYIVSMYHHYPTTEHRFYANTEFFGLSEDEMMVEVRATYGDTMEKGIEAARSARFEHGERHDI
jgi:hypothetical protein